MAKYTIELRTIIENGINIFDFPYDFYNNDKKADFERDFIRHFYFREIGVETIDKFKFYLEDKMNVVFPYYNKLMQASEVEYDLLDHYRLEEVIEREIDNKNAVSGVSSSVGRFSGEQENNTTTDETGNNKSNTVNTGSDKTTEESARNTKTEKDGTVKTESEENGTTSNETDVQGTDVSINKFLDTPQGKLNLNDSKYLTELRQEDKNTSNITNQNGTSNINKDETVTTEETINNDETFNGEISKDTTFTSDVEDDSTAHGESNSKTTDVQQSNQDINSRTHSNGTQKEISKLTRTGNIGVQTDAEGIEKHVLLRKTLDNLKRMFFDECEDLFMGVY